VTERDVRADTELEVELSLAPALEVELARAVPG
jgi:hypothetical protein